MPEQSHLLNCLVLGHLQNDKLFTPTDQWQEFTCLAHRQFFFRYLSSRTPVPTPMIVLAFITVYLALNFVEGRNKSSTDIICTFLGAQNKAFAMNGDLRHLSIQGVARRFCI